MSYQCPEFLPRREIELIGTLGGARACNTMGQTPGGWVDWREPDTEPALRYSTADPGLSPFARQIEAFSAARVSGRCWPYTPERDLRHFELLLDALHRAEHTVTDRGDTSVGGQRRQ